MKQNGREAQGKTILDEAVSLIEPLTMHGCMSGRSANVDAGPDCLGCRCSSSSQMLSDKAAATRTPLAGQDLACCHNYICWAADRAFVRVTDQPPQTKWATGSNLAFVSYAADPERSLVIAMGVVDNLGKGAAGQAVQNANLICGLSETAGLAGLPIWP